MIAITACEPILHISKQRRFWGTKSRLQGLEYPELFEEESRSTFTQLLIARFLKIPLKTA